MPKSKPPIFVGDDKTCVLCEARGFSPLGKAFWDTPLAALNGSWGYVCRNHGIYRTPAARRVTTNPPKTG